ncbi:MAG TPA: nucleotidyltransferase family protein, partial [Gemmatimonadaceae bacterium]
LADRERATPVVWRLLAKECPELVPSDVAESFRRQAMVSEFTGLLLEDRARELLNALEAARIDVILLKGAALAHTVYRGFVDRPMIDLDLLVASEHARQAWRIAQSLGWQWHDTVFPAARYEHHHHLPPLVDARSGRFAVEIHIAGNVPGHPFSLAFPTAFPETQPVPGRKRVYALAPEHQVVHLAIHCAWAHLLTSSAWRTFRDLHALTAGREVDWDRVVELARRYHGASSAYWTLWLAAELTDLVVPAATVEALSRGIPRFMRRAIARHLVGQMFPSPEPCPSESLKRAIWTYAIQPRTQGVGSARPWDADDMALPAADADSSRRRLWNPRAWWRYLRVVALPG